MTVPFIAKLSKIDNLCDSSTILFKCTNIQLIIKTIAKLCILFPIFYFGIKYFGEGNLKLHREEIAFCASVVAYITFEFAFENFLPIQELTSHETLSSRLYQLPLSFWFICQCAYLAKIAKTLKLIGISLNKGATFAIQFFKYSFITFIFVQIVVLYVPIKTDSKFFKIFYQTNFRWDSVVFYFLHAIILLTLNIFFVFSDKMMVLFHDARRYQLNATIFAYGASLLFDMIAFTFGHTKYFAFKLSYTKRNSYLWLDIILKILYYDVPPVTMFLLMLTINEPNTEQESEKQESVLHDQLDMEKL